MNDLEKIREQIIELRDHVHHVRCQIDPNLGNNQIVYEQATGQIRGFEQSLKIIERFSKEEKDNKETH